MHPKHVQNWTLTPISKPLLPLSSLFQHGSGPRPQNHFDSFFFLHSLSQLHWLYPQNVFRMQQILPTSATSSLVCASLTWIIAVAATMVSPFSHLTPTIFSQHSTLASLKISIRSYLSSARNSPMASQLMQNKIQVCDLNSWLLPPTSLWPHLPFILPLSLQWPPWQSLHIPSMCLPWGLWLAVSVATNDHSPDVHMAYFFSAYFFSLLWFLLESHLLFIYSF